MSQRLFFIISGEHPTLPEAELRAILEAEECQFRLVKSVPKLLLVETPGSSLNTVSSRSSMCTISGIAILECPDDQASIQEAIRESDLSNTLESGDSFSVRVAKAGSARSTIGSEVLEAFVGNVIQETIHDLSVDLTSPEKPLIGILYDGRFVLGLEKYRREAGSFASRRPRKRPVFHPSTMAPKLARCMVNLARPKRGGLVLDPFCGVGGILIEANLVGCRALGCDIRLKRVRDSLVNMKYFGLEPVGMLQADARTLPSRQVDAIVTDPPYGTAASTHGLSTHELFKQFLKSAYETVSAGGCMCIGAPSKVNVDALGEDAGWIPLEHHEVYVHRSLTREIAVFKRE